MARNEILIPSRIASSITAEASNRSLDAPNTNLRGQMAVDLLNDIRIFDDELQRDDVAGSVYALVGASTTHQGRFLGIIGIGLGYGAGSHEGGEEVAFDGTLIGHDLHPFVSAARVTDHDGNLA